MAVSSISAIPIPIPIPVPIRIPIPIPSPIPNPLSCAGALLSSWASPVPSESMSSNRQSLLSRSPVARREESDADQSNLTDSAHRHHTSYSNGVWQRLMRCVVPCVYEDRPFYRVFPCSSPDLIVRTLHMIFIYVCLYVPGFVSVLIQTERGKDRMELW